MYKIITKENFQTSVSNFEIEKLNETATQEYLSLSTLYRTLLNEYIKTICINDFDEAIKNSGLNFIPIEDENQDFYQYYNNSGLTYYYVRNNIYLERLTEEETKFLKSKLSSQDLSLTKEDMNFISQTFSKVIKEIHDGVEEPFDTNYGPTSTGYFAPSNALVIGFRYDRFKNNGMDEDRFFENLMKQKSYSLNLNSQLQEILQSQLQLPVKVIEYNENSVKKNITHDDAEKGMKL